MIFVLPKMPNGPVVAIKGVRGAENPQVSSSRQILGKSSETKGQIHDF